MISALLSVGWALTLCALVMVWWALKDTVERAIKAEEHVRILSDQGNRYIRQLDAIDAELKRMGVTVLIH
jgi:hypothetical protein